MFFGLLVGFLMSFIVYCAYILVIAFMLWMAVDAAKQDRFWWVVIIFGVPVIGGAVYFFTEKKHEYAKAPVHHIHTSETEQQHEVSHKKKVTRKSKTSPETGSLVAENSNEHVISENQEGGNLEENKV
jgi:hypothetical protein